MIKKFLFSYLLLASLFIACTSDDEALVDMLKGYYEEAMGQPVEEIRTPGCVEPAFFCLYHPGLQTTCIGPKITEAHTINETLYLNTLRPVVQTVVNTMQHINMVAR